MVLPLGVEPKSTASEASILSIELRERKSPLTLYVVHSQVNLFQGNAFALTNSPCLVMLISMRKLLCCIFLALIASVSLMAQSDVLAPIERNLNGDVIPVAVKSSDSGIQSLLTKAYGVHGAYTVATSDKADFTLSVEPTGATSVKLEILSGSPAKSLFTAQVQGSSLMDAALRAADLAVTKTSGLKGIFAGKIAFIGQRSGTTELYEGGLLFQEVSQLTHDNVQCVRPNFSPDGKTILYTSYFRNGFPDIYKIDIASRKREVFLSFNGMNTGAAFSPDGSKVAMILSGTGNAELYVIGSDCKNMVRLTKNKSLESDPTWSPDGKSIIFTSDEPGKPQIFMISANGGSMQRVPTRISKYCAEPSWNPENANLIAFTIAQDSAFEVAVFDRSNSEPRTVSEGVGDAVEPAWTRDGRHLIYTERTPNHRRLVLLDTKTGHKAYLNSAEWGDASQANYIYQ